MILDYLRLAFATALVLLPGRLVARAVGQKSTSATLAWALASLFLAWAVVFTVHGTVWLAAGIVAAIGVAALLVGRPRSGPVIATGHWHVRVTALRRRAAGGHGWVFALGILLGLLLWHVAGAVGGDGLFHLARVRKLVDLGDLHLRTVDEFKDGGLHPGYAFPLWHGFLALVAKLSGLDPYVVVDHEASLLVPLACAVAWEAGVAVFGSSGGGVSVLAASVAVFCFAPGHGGAYVSLALPATAARQLLVPAALALFFGYAGSGSRADLAAIAAVVGALALVHPTYALFLLLPLGGYAVVRLAEWRRSAAALAAAGIPSLLAYLWLRPLVNQTLSHDPSAQTQRNALQHYGDMLVVSSLHHYRLAAEVIGRTGAVAVAALALVPLAGLAARRRWGAFVLGGTVVMLGLLLVPALFTRFSDFVSLSQSRRAAGFVPLAFAFAGGLSLLARSVVVVPLALVAGTALDQVWPGDFAYGLREGGPAVITWVALGGGAVALVLGVLLARDRPVERFGLGAFAAALFVLPVAIRGFSHWSPLRPVDSNALSPALRRELARVPPRSVVIAAPETSYEILAAAPVYVVAAPLPHVANTRANDPQRRIDDVERWLKTGDPAIPRRYGATWAVKGGRLYRLPS